MISPEKWMILTLLQKLPKNGGDWGKLIVAKCFKKLAKVKINRLIWSHWLQQQISRTTQITFTFCKITDSETTTESGEEDELTAKATFRAAANLDMETYRPFLVKLVIYKPDKDRYICTGSLINSKFILTAAHCVCNVFLSCSESGAASKIVEDTDQCEEIHFILFLNRPIPASFSVYFRLFNMLQFKFNFKLKKVCAWDSNPGSMMEGANESTELRRHPKFYTFLNGPISASFLFIFVFSTLHNSINWWKHNWCALDSNPGRQGGRCRWIHWAIAATRHFIL